MCSIPSAQNDLLLQRNVDLGHSSSVTCADQMKKNTPTIQVSALPSAVLSPLSRASIKKKTPLRVNNIQPISARRFEFKNASSHRCVLRVDFVSGTGSRLVLSVDRHHFHR